MHAKTPTPPKMVTSQSSKVAKKICLAEDRSYTVSVPNLLTPGTNFVEKEFIHEQEDGEWFQDDDSILHLLCTLFLFLLH